MLEREFDFEVHLDGDEMNHHVSIFNLNYLINLIYDLIVINIVMI